MSKANGKIKGGPLSTHVTNMANTFRLLVEGCNSRVAPAFRPSPYRHLSAKERLHTP
jgi:hypothetical protein